MADTPIAAGVKRPAPTRITYTPEQRALIRRLCCTDREQQQNSATDEEFEGFISMAERLQLDPLSRQINFIKRSGKGRGEPSIDGLRLVAERTGEYAGQTPREWAHSRITGNAATITWYPVWPFQQPPLAARVGVYRVGFAEPLFAVARFEAYAQKKRDGDLNSMWAKMGPEQLAKCAEALALRQAFPNELSGVYTTEEMEQADPDAVPPPVPARAEMVATTEQAAEVAERALTAVAGPPVAPLPPAPTTPSPARQPATQGAVAAAATHTTPPVHVLAISPQDQAALPGRIQVFPYGELLNVPLGAVWPARLANEERPEGQYVVSEGKLREAEVKVSDRKLQLETEKAGGWEAKVRYAETVLNDIADELQRRNDERTQGQQQAQGGAA